MKNGNCYQVHCEAMFDEAIDMAFSEDWRLCHGTVFHQDVGWHGHCWIEIGNGHIVRDGSNGHDVTVRREGYYRAGKVKDVQRYTREEASRMALKEGTYGPWSIK